MSIVSIFLILISATIHVLWNFLTKSSQNPRVFSLLKVTAIMGLAAATVMYFPLQEITREVWIYITISGMLHGFYLLSLSSAYEVGDISYVYPIARSAPAFVPLAAFLVLGENISVQGAIGILVVLVGMYTLLMRGDTGKELHRLWASMKKKDSRWAFVTLCAVVAYSIIDKAGMLALSEIETIAPVIQGSLFLLLENIFCCLLFWAYMILRSDLKLRPILAREWPKVVVAALCTFVSYSLILYVMRNEKVSYIVTMRQASVLLAVLAGWLFLKERDGKIRLIASVIMLMGFYLVCMAE